LVLKWEIFHIESCRHAKPNPKNKFVLIAYINPSPHGFFINSKINKYIENKPYLLSCEAPILSNQHNFLVRDSYVDCREMFPFDSDELTDSKGLLSMDGQSSVLKAVDLCPVLEQIHKNRINNTG
jgi:hypothetical protein